MDAETRRTLATTVLSTLVRASFVFLALREYDRENDASAQKINEKTREKEGERRERREKKRKEREREGGEERREEGIRRGRKGEK